MTTHRKPPFIVFANQKGGVAKTTTTTVLGHGLAIRGLRTLVLDLDSQGHAALALGLERQPGLYGLIVQEKHPDDVIIQARDNLDLLPGDRTTERVKQHVTTMSIRREYVLRDRLKPVLDRYDAILIDCAPSADILHTSAFAIADWLLVPAKLSGLDMDGVSQVMAMAATIRQGVPGCVLDLAGILPTFYERRTNETSTQLKLLFDKFGGYIWPPIPQDVKAREAPSYNQTLWEYAPTTPAIVGYAANNGVPRRVGGYQAALEKLLQLLAKN